jgi:hypothetical protein
MSAVVVEDFRRLAKNTLRGFVRARFPPRIIIAEISIHVGADGKAWASPPSRPMLDRDGAAMRDQDGKVRWQPLMTFASGKIRNAWSQHVIDALLSLFPDALEVAP